MKKRRFLLALLAAGLVSSAGAFAACGGGDIHISVGGNETCKHENIEHTEPNAATCTEDGNQEYWYCSDCKKYFSDSAYKNETTLAAVTINAGHSYGEYVYDYTAKQYVRTCSANSGHKETLSAGESAQYPYLANNVEALTATIANGGYIKLESDMAITAPIEVTNTVYINLDGKTITSTANAFELSGDANVTLIGGTVNSVGRSINMAGAAALTLDQVTLKAKSQGIVSVASGAINITGGKINSDSYPVYLIPTALSYGYNGNPAYKIEFNVDGLEVVTRVDVGFWFVAVDADIKNTEISVDNAKEASACVFTLGGTTLKMTDCTLTNPVGSGLQGNGTDTLGDRLCGRDVDITLTDCTVTGGLCALYLPQVDGKTVINGGTYTATKKSAVEIRAGSLEINASAKGKQL